MASDPTISRLFATLCTEATDADAAITAIRAARAGARERVWARRRPLGGTVGKRAGGQVIIDIDATLVDSHSDKQHAEPTHKRTYGFAPLCAFVDHGADGTGEPLALNLRPGNASPWKSADHISALKVSCAVIAFNIARAAAVAAGLAKARWATLRRKIIRVAARVASTSRRLDLHLPIGWPWAHGWQCLHALATGPPPTATN